MSELDKQKLEAVEAQIRIQLYKQLGLQEVLDKAIEVKKKNERIMQQLIKELNECYPPNKK